MGYDGRAVANFVLDFGDSGGIEITNLSLQKLVYFCHVWSLIDFGKPLVRHRFEAWEYGPVLPYLYREFKRFGDSPISSRATRINTARGTSEVVDCAFDDKTESHLIEILNFYIRIRLSDLVEFSHVKGGPWHTVWHHAGTINPGMKIDDAEIARFYSKMPRPLSIQ